MKKIELVFIPTPGMGHLIPMVETAKLLVSRDDRLFITLLIMRLQADSKVDAYIQSLTASSSISTRMKFINLPQVTFDTRIKSSKSFDSFIEDHKPHVQDVVSKLISESHSISDSPQLAGFFIDMFCTTMIDVANDFGVPTYMFFTSGAAFLGFQLHAQYLLDEHNIHLTEFKNKPDAELIVPGFVNPVSGKVLPAPVLNEDGLAFVVQHSRRTRELKGILVNTFMELEPHALQSKCQGICPQLYPVGPIINSSNTLTNQNSDIIKWLDDQPLSSVVFLCFGSMGSFLEDQVREIARALELTGFRFLWSLRKPQEMGQMVAPSDYEDLKEVLTQDFLDRTAGIGKVIGWAPQVAVLAHPAIGGFVSHCGWNSTLESLWFGVPIATWPLYAEQQMNAFEMVSELGLAVEVKMDYRKSFNNETEPEILRAEEVEKGIMKLMEVDSEVRKKVKEMSEKSRKALMEGGSSYNSLGRLINDVIDSFP